METKTIYRIHERTRELVELRRWTVRKDAETGEEGLCIRDCLEEKDIYAGNVIRYDTEDLKNEKYYQYLLWKGLEKFRDDENDSPIRFYNEQPEEVEYEDKQAFLADHGFAFEEVETGVWEPQDTFSTQDISGKYTREQHWPRETYVYTTIACFWIGAVAALM